jgi:hypothetical protein
MKKLIGLFGLGVALCLGSFSAMAIAPCYTNVTFSVAAGDCISMANVAASGGTFNGTVFTPNVQLSSVGCTVRDGSPYIACALNAGCCPNTPYLFGQLSWNWACDGTFGHANVYFQPNTHIIEIKIYSVTGNCNDHSCFPAACVSYSQACNSQN